jgi:hypothetical protein
MKALRFNTILFNNNTAATNDFAGVALTVNLAETSPGTKDLGVSDFDQVDLVLRTKGLDKFDILGLRASLDEDAKVGLTFVKSLGALTETTSKTIVDKSIFQNLL